MENRARRVALVMPSATYRAADFSSAASALGLELVVVTEHRQALSGPMTWRALQVDLCDPEEAARSIVQLAAGHPLDAVVAVDDQGVETAALASEALGLATSPVSAVHLTRDKLDMRRCLADAGVAQPAFAALSDGAADTGDLPGGLGWPVVVKPTGLSASRGVIRADDSGALMRAAGRIRAILDQEGRPSGESLLVEQFVAGPELAVEGMVRAGRVEVLAVFDKPDPLDGPFFEETIYVTPSRQPPDVVDGVHRLVAAATSALGLTHGPFHAEIRLGADGPVVLEVAARSIGGLCSRALRFGAGVSLEQLILAGAIGLDLEGLGPTVAASGVMMIPIPAAGRLREIQGLGAARAVRLVDGVEITVPIGAVVRPLPEGDRYLGFIFASGPGPLDVETALRAAHGHLKVVLEGAPVPA